jgi:hypothetical protein
MPLDPRRLARDAKTLEAKRPAGAIGRETTGVTRAVRALMPAIRELRQAGVRWAAIAEALARQGVVGSDGQPLKANRLTAVVDRIAQGERGKAAKADARGGRPDLSASPPPDAVPQQPHVPITDPPSRPDTRHRTAEQIRRDDLSDLDAILKGTKR